MKLRDPAKKKGEYGWEAEVIDKDCFKRPCYRVHDWDHKGNYVCITNYSKGCPHPTPEPEDKE